MSIKIMFKAMQIETGSPASKLVLLKLADNANDEGQCWPSYESIAKTCEISTRSAQRHIKELEKKGLIHIEKKNNKLGHNYHFYTLNINQNPVDKMTTGNEKPSGQSVQTHTTNCPHNLSSESVNHNVGSATQHSLSFAEKRKQGFDYFWKRWSEAKKLIGKKNTAPKPDCLDKFNKLFPIKQIETKGKQWFSDEINGMCQLVWIAFNDLAECKETNQSSDYFRFENMMPQKFFTQKQWRDDDFMRQESA